MTSSFPTLAEQLAAAPRPETETAPAVVVLEHADAAAHVAGIVRPDSPIVTERDGALDVRDGERTETVPGNLPAALRRLLLANREDVLLVSDVDLLTPTTLARLGAGLAADSACTTVSVDQTSHARAEALPPPGAVAPRRGLVIVRRDDLLLALDEAGLAGRENDDTPPIGPVDDGRLVPDLLAALGRPGFLHRAIGRDAPTAPRVARVRSAANTHFAVQVVLDGRCLAQPLSGTQVQLLGLLGGLRDAGVDVAVLRPHEVHPTVAADVARMRGDVPFVDRSRIGRPAVFHRPFQVASLHDLADCVSIGERLVLTHQDMIRDRTPAYTSSIDAWRDYRRATGAALMSADEVGFFSRHAAADAASDEALELDRATVVHLGVDHLSERDVAATAAHPLRGRPYLLVLGNAFWHKNRLFALRLVRWLVEREGWDGGLVLAGEDPRIGSSVVAEQALIRAAPTLRDRVVDVGRVSDAEQVGLYRGAELVLFPSLYEGFGLIPFEAASLGTACVYAYRASMRELLPCAGALPSFDLEEAGPFVLSLLTSASARSHVVAEIEAAAAELTWARTAAGYTEVYSRAVASEPRAVSRLLVGIDPSGSPKVTQREAVLLDVYRRRRVFRLAVDGALRAGAAAVRGARDVRRKERS